MCTLKVFSSPVDDMLLLPSILDPAAVRIRIHGKSNGSHGSDSNPFQQINISAAELSQFTTPSPAVPTQYTLDLYPKLAGLASRWVSGMSLALGIATCQPSNHGRNSRWRFASPSPTPHLSIWTMLARRPGLAEITRWSPGNPFY